MSVVAPVSDTMTILVEMAVVPLVVVVIEETSFFWA
jgi:hypothetical protein